MVGSRLRDDVGAVVNRARSERLAPDHGSPGRVPVALLKDFPVAACAPYDIEIQAADEFLSYALDQDPPGAVGAIRTMATKRRNPPMTPLDLLTAFTEGLPMFTTDATPHLGSIRSGPELPQT